jgi:hypothetical protein
LSTAPDTGFGFFAPAFANAAFTFSTFERFFAGLLANCDFAAPFGIFSACGRVSECGYFALQLLAHNNKVCAKGPNFELARRKNLHILGKRRKRSTRRKNHSFRGSYRRY